MGCGDDGLGDHGGLGGMDDGVASDFGDVFADEHRVSLWSLAGFERGLEESRFSGEDLVSESVESERGGGLLESSLERGLFPDDAESGWEANRECPWA